MGSLTWIMDVQFHLRGIVKYYQRNEINMKTLNASKSDIPFQNYEEINAKDIFTEKQDDSTPLKILN